MTYSNAEDIDTLIDRTLNKAIEMMDNDLMSPRDLNSLLNTLLKIKNDKGNLTLQRQELANVSNEDFMAGIDRLLEDNRHFLGN